MIHLRALIAIGWISENIVWFSFLKNNATIQNSALGNLEFSVLVINSGCSLGSTLLWGKSEIEKTPFLSTSGSLRLRTVLPFQAPLGLPTWIPSLLDSRNVSKEHLQENHFRLESFCLGTIMQTAGRIYLTFSQLLIQLEIIDSPSAMIKMERLNAEVLFFTRDPLSW